LKLLSKNELAVIGLRIFERKGRLDG